MDSLVNLLLKARSGVYEDTSKNRRLHRVGQHYGTTKDIGGQETDKKTKYEERVERLKRYQDQILQISHKITSPGATPEEIKLGRELFKKMNEKIQALDAKIKKMKKPEGFDKKREEIEKEAQKGKLEENRKAISERYSIPIGEPMSFEEADGYKVNPHFMESKAYRRNCQTCVVAYELRRRGFDVSAKRRSNDNSNQTILARHSTYVFPDAKPNSIDQNISIKEYCDKVEELTKGEGRYHFSFSFSYDGGKYGHIITLERELGGNLFAYDPQSGVKKSVEDYMKGFELIPDLKSQLFRVDNIEISVVGINGLLDLRGKPKLDSKGRVRLPQDPNEPVKEKPYISWQKGLGLRVEKYHTYLDIPGKGSWLLSDKESMKVLYRERDILKEAISVEDFAQKAGYEVSEKWGLTKEFEKNGKLHYIMFQPEAFRLFFEKFKGDQK